MLEKHFEEQVGKKLWKTILKNKLGKNFGKEFTRTECCHYNEVGRKINSNFFILSVLPKIKLWIWWK